MDGGAIFLVILLPWVLQLGAAQIGYALAGGDGYKGLFVGLIFVALSTAFNSFIGIPLVGAIVAAGLAIWVSGRRGIPTEHALPAIIAAFLVSVVALFIFFAMH